MSFQLPEAAAGADAPYKLAANLPYEYPLPEGLIGSAIKLNEKTPRLFQPLKIKNLTLPNRVGVSPMVQYAADNNAVTDYHKIHYGGFSLRGPGLIVIEASSVVPHAGSSIADLGFWKDSQAEKLRPIVEFAHANTAKIGIQLAHAGQKAMQSQLFNNSQDWDPRGHEDHLVGPSSVADTSGGKTPKPRALTVDEIKSIVERFGEAARRAHKIGLDFVEIHAANGYLLNEFLSTHSNNRTDQYGGSFENRIRFLLEVIDAVRDNVPKDFAVFLKWSGYEVHESNPHAWSVEDSVKLAPIVAAKGIDLLDISRGANDSSAKKSADDITSYLDTVRRVKEAVGNKALVSTVGGMHDPVKVNELLEEGVIDFTFVGSPFMVNQGLVYEWAKVLDVELHHAATFWSIRPKYAEMIK